MLNWIQEAEANLHNLESFRAQVRMCQNDLRTPEHILQNRTLRRDLRTQTWQREKSLVEKKKNFGHRLRLPAGYGIHGASPSQRG